MFSKQIVQGFVLAIILVTAILLLLGLADSGRAGSACTLQFPKWLGCVLAAHEDLAGGLIGGSGALFAAWVAWNAVMRQIGADADQAYEAVRVELEPVVGMINLYWRVVDAALRNKAWKQNGIFVIMALYPSVRGLHQHLAEVSLERLSPSKRRQFRRLAKSLSFVAERMDLEFGKEPLWYETVQIMLTHFWSELTEFDAPAARKLRRRKKANVDPRTMAEHCEPIVAEFERGGNMSSDD